MPKLPTWRQMHMDTSPAVEAVQFAALRTWPLWRKLAMTAALTRTARGAVWAGICQRYPAVSTHTLQQHFSDILYGAASVYVSQHQLFEESAMQDLDLIDVTLHVTTVLEQLGVDYVVVGSLASTLYGIPRSTVDADLVADLRPEHVGALVDALKDAFSVDALSILAAIDTHSSFNLIHLATLFKVDVFIPKPRVFEQKQFEQGTARVIAVNPQRTARIASAEDTILAKLEWFRLGGESSERQWRDVLGILKQVETIDLAYLRSQAEELNVVDLLESALTEVERPG